MLKKKGFTLIEIMIVVAIIALVAAIGLPNLIRVRINANETSAISSMRTVSNSLITYSVANGSYNGATLNGLATSTPPYIDTILGCAAPPCTKAGYSFSEITVSADSTTYVFTAQPVIVNTTGGRSFCVTEDGVVRAQANGGAIADHDSCLLLGPA